jgi:hypothetical protein
MRTTTEQEIDQKYETILIEAYERGKQQGWHDKLQGYENPTPLSGEWAGESIPEILGDLIASAVELNGVPDNGGRLRQDICDNYETGYFDGNCD